MAPSAVPITTCLAGLVGLIASATLCWQLTLTPAAAAALTLTGVIVPMWWLELRRHRSKEHQETTQIGWPTLGMTALPWLLAAVLLDRTVPWFAADTWVPVMLVILVALVFFYRADDVNGHFAQLDRFLKTKQGQIPKASLLALIVKPFFMPLMFSFLLGWWSITVNLQLSDPLGWFYLAVGILFLIDVAFAAVGYLPSPRGTKAEIRSANPYPDAWLATLVCYPPLWLWLSPLLQYDINGGWSHTIPEGIWQAIWGSLLIGLLIIYAVSSVVFGPRFSNLTYRGVITAGPYRWIRHPAYTAKVAFWWLSALPFLPVMETSLTITATFSLLCLTTIYWMRAITEERHLLRYADYRRYWRITQRNSLNRLWSGGQCKPSPKGTIRRCLRRKPIIVPLLAFGLLLLVRPIIPSWGSGEALLPIGIQPPGSTTVLCSQGLECPKPNELFHRRNLQPDLNAPFPFASLSKPVLASFILALEKEGSLSIADEVMHHSLDFSQMTALEGLTIAELLAHRSLFRFSGSIDDPLFSPAGLSNCEKAITLIEASKSTHAEAFKYQNVNYCLLEKVLEHSTSQSFLQELEDVFPALAAEAQNAKEADARCRAMETLGAVGGYCYRPESILHALRSIVAEHGDTIAAPVKNENYDWGGYGYGFRVWRVEGQILLTHFGYLNEYFSLFISTLNGQDMLIAASAVEAPPQEVFEILLERLAPKFAKVLQPEND